MKMSLKDWEDSGWLRPHKTGPKEISGLLNVVDRELSDAGQLIISVDGRFTHAYQAALQLCTILLCASGYKAPRESNHYRTLAALPLILGRSRADDARYLDACRIKRNDAEYRLAGATTDSDAKELLEFAVGFRKDVLKWLKANHPELAR
jgi:hypothetical protein